MAKGITLEERKAKNNGNTVVYTVLQLTEILNMHENHIYDLIHTNRLPVLRDSLGEPIKPYRVPKVALNKMLDACK